MKRYNIAFRDSIGMCYTPHIHIEADDSTSAASKAKVWFENESNSHMEPTVIITTTFNGIVGEAGAFDFITLAEIDRR